VAGGIERHREERGKVVRRWIRRAQQSPFLPAPCPSSPEVRHASASGHVRCRWSLPDSSSCNSHSRSSAAAAAQNEVVASMQLKGMTPKSGHRACATSAASVRRKSSYAFCRVRKIEIGSAPTFAGEKAPQAGASWIVKGRQAPDAGRHAVLSLCHMYAAYALYMKTTWYSKTPVLPRRR